MHHLRGQKQTKLLFCFMERAQNFKVFWGRYKMSGLVESVAHKTGLPQWWVEAIAIEYTDCREYAGEEDIWGFNFEKVAEDELMNAVHSQKVVISRGVIFHNVLEEVVITRGIERFVSNVPVPLPKELEDLIPEGPISSYHFPFGVNSIDEWDPKLSLYDYFQVFDDEQIWQWRFAKFTKVKGRQYG